jgi:glycosyltransferase involved in cell wall biosynthesis
MKKRIAFIVPMLAPYRVTFYEKLFNNSDNEWWLFHGTKKEEDGRPQYNQTVSFKNISFNFGFFKIGPFELYYHSGLNKKVKSFNPEIIIIYGNPGVISNILLMKWAKKQKIKVILWVCSWDSGTLQGVSKRFKRIVSQFYYFKADAFITYGTHAKTFLINLGIQAEKIRIAFNGIETDNILINKNKILNEAKSIRLKYAKSDDLIFIYVGGLIVSKKILELIDQFNFLNRRYSNIKLWIIGDGTLRNIVQLKLEKLANENIKYFGRIINDVDNYFAASDCLVLPGAGGLALNQAMFWMKPCICSIADGTEEDLVFDGDTGFYFERNNWIDLQNTMERFIKTPEVKRREMGEKGHDLIINQSNVNNMVEIFKEAVKNV